MHHWCIITVPLRLPAAFSLIIVRRKKIKWTRSPVLRSLHITAHHRTVCSTSLHITQYHRTVCSTSLNITQYHRTVCSTSLSITALCAPRHSTSLHILPLCAPYHSTLLHITPYISPHCVLHIRYTRPPTTKETGRTFPNHTRAA